MTKSITGKSAADETMSEKRSVAGAAQVFEQALSGFRASNPQPWIELLAEDAVLELPFAPPGRPGRLRGKDNIIKYFQSSPANIDFKSFTDVQIHRTADPDCVVVELTGSGTVKTTNDPYEMRYVIVLQTKEGLIHLQRDYFNPLTAIDT